MRLIARGGEGKLGSPKLMKVRLIFSCLLAVPFGSVVLVQALAVLLGARMKVFLHPYER
jgi:hypothetical protein